MGVIWPLVTKSEKM